MVEKVAPHLSQLEFEKVQASGLDRPADGAESDSLPSVADFRPGQVLAHVDEKQTSQIADSGNKHSEEIGDV